MLRRPSIPFEAIGLRSRLRGAVVVVHPAPQKDVTMTKPDPNEPVVPPTDPVEETQSPPAVPADFEDDDEEEIEGIDEEDDE